MTQKTREAALRGAVGEGAWSGISRSLICVISQINYSRKKSEHAQEVSERSEVS